MQNTLTHPVTQQKAQFNIGDVVVLASFPAPIDELKAGKGIDIDLPTHMVPPLMVVLSARLADTNNPAQSFAPDKQIIYSCMWFDAKGGGFKEASFYEPLLQLVKPSTQVLAESQVSFGIKVILFTLRTQALVTYNKLYSSVFFAPIMLVTNYRVNSQPIKESKGVVIEQVPTAYVRCKWYNAAKAKFVEDKFPVEAIELV